MKALQVIRPREFIQVETPIPDLNAAGLDRILVQPTWVSMCGSDIPFFTGSKRHRAYPLTAAAPIHECVGRVVESTSNLFQPGDKVIAIPEGDKGLVGIFCSPGSQSRQIAV